ncbi:MAG: alpha/beta fold hydrolase [Chitinophagaceae bacterium]
MKVYFISGLAADKRVFKHIELPPHCEVIHLDWIAPIKKESLSAYSKRLGEKINCSEPFCVVGLSMGGMIAIEIARHYQPAHTILISSIPLSQHLPFYFKWAVNVRLHKIVPTRFVKSAAIAKRFFTNETKEDKIIIKQIVRDSDPKFIVWAMEAIATWQNNELPVSYIHIHGTKDEVLPHRLTQPTHTISKGGHLMVMTRAKEINQILQEIL